MKLGEVMYKEAAEKQKAQGGHAGDDGKPTEEKPKEGPVDAEYEPSDAEKK